MNYTVTAYLVYLPITTILTIWVATTLFKNGKVFLKDIFGNDEEIANSVNKLLLVGFYLVNIGYMVYTMRIIGTIEDYQIMMEKLSTKIGFIILFLGAMHFFNIFVLFRLRKKNPKKGYQVTPPIVE